MAKTSNPNIFVVTPSYAASAITTRKNNKGKPKGQRRHLPYYMNMFETPDLKKLSTPGTVISTTTKAGRPITVISVESVAQGSTLRVRSGQTIETLIIKPQEV